MSEILSWLGWAGAALLAAAIVVAGCEQLVREARGQRVDCGACRAERTGIAVDVPLDTASAALLNEAATPLANAAADRPVTEAAARVAAMTQALTRAAHPGRAAHDGGRWMDTTPRVVGLAEPVLRDRPARPGAHRDAAADEASDLDSQSGAREASPGQHG